MGKRKANSGEEKKRGFLRIPFKKEVNFQLLSVSPQGKELDLVGRGDNISLSGICIDVSKEHFLHSFFHLDVSSIIWMSFFVPGSDGKIKLQGEVKRIWHISEDMLRIGVMFINISSKDYRTIHDFIDSA